VQQSHFKLFLLKITTNKYPLIKTSQTLKALCIHYFNPIVFVKIRKDYSFIQCKVVGKSCKKWYNVSGGSWWILKGFKNSEPATNQVKQYFEQLIHNPRKGNCYERRAISQ
jgi:hypothetical protein